MSNNENPKEQMAEVIDFDKCPHCGSSNGLAITLYKGQAEKGHVRKMEKYGIYEFSGPIVDLEMVKLGKVLIGTKVPYMAVTIDVCQDCGALYAVRITKTEMATAAAPLNPQGGFDGINLPFGRG